MDRDSREQAEGPAEAESRGDPAGPPAEDVVTWSPEAWARVQNAPAFVRPGIKKLMVLRAKERGLDVITSDLLTEMRNSSMMKVSRRLQRFGFSNLSPEAFEMAKEKMRRRPRRVEVIEDIQDHLARRQKKNKGIIALFKKYMASVSEKKR